MEDHPVVPHLSDSHFHSTAMADRGLDPRSILTDLRAAHGGIMLDVAIEPEDCARQRQLTGGVPHVYYSAGVHPSRSDREDWDTAFSRVEAKINGGAYHAVGETGLDWFRMYAPRERQLTLFERHLSLAQRARLPVIVHNREADQDVLEALRRIPPSVPGVMHCFSSDREWVKRFLDAGMFISFAGNVTFKNASGLRDALRYVPEEQLLLETDAPFLAPHPYRGRDNHPGLLVHTVRVAAAERGLTPERLAEITERNLATMLSVPLP